VRRIQNKYKKLTRILSLVFLPVLLLLTLSWNNPPVQKKMQTQDQWVDSVLKSMSLEERIAQLFMVAAYSNKTDKHVKEIDVLVSKYNIGGVIFFQGGPVRQAILTNHYQSLSKVPLMVAMDAEWGLGMRLDSTISFPKQMTLGAIQDNKEIYTMGKEIARQCRRLGVHINFAPSVDINSNPANPVIGVRSFGEDKYSVAEKGSAYMKGMQDNFVMANAKHFPGHGDTETDSHSSLPIINHDKKRLDEMELYPFKKLIMDSVMSIMVAHINIPALDNRENMATTLSRAVVTDLLKTELQFKGLVFTDALNMKGVSSFHKPGEVDLKALLAGNDVLLYAEDVPIAIEKIRKAIRKDDVTEEEINEKVKKILRAKYWLGLNDYKAIETKNLVEDLNNSKAKAIQMDLYAKALTVITNKNNLVPFRMLDTTSFASISIGLDSGNIFQSTLSSYAAFDHYTTNKNAEEEKFDELLLKLKKYEVVVIGLHNTNIFNNKNFGISENAKKFISKLNLQNKTVLAVFGNAYSLKYFTDSPHLICAYEDNEITQKLVPQLLFGGITANGKIPVTAHAKIPVGKGIALNSDVKRFGYAYPENVKVDSRTLSYVDSICFKAIHDGATPGCQVLIAKEGKIIFDKCYGSLTYGNSLLDPVLPSTLYDIASITKVAGTLQAFMFLEERGLVDLDKKASYYLPELIGTNKEDLELRNILTHQAGLTPFLPHWKKTVDTSGYDTLYYSRVRSEKFPNEVVPGLYSTAAMEDSLWKWTIESKLLSKQEVIITGKKSRRRRVVITHKDYEYVYSDLGFYITKRIAEKLLNQNIDDFMQDNFFSPLGLRNILYKPLERFPASKIAPTEDDKYFRFRVIQGNVHDQGAAMLGGVGGHAGLFSNAHDLAVLMQMNIQNGYYGGIRYFLPETVPRFAKRQFDTNRRGLGWDKPEGAGQGPTSYHASSNTFGHTGFTGTCVWADPDQQIVYVFLSNRIHKDASNPKLVRLGVRTAIQDVIYKAIWNYKD
jgi:beta-N-acetylhexosaminidase